MARQQKKTRQARAAALEKAFEKHQAGQLGAAARAYRAILKHAPDHPDALHLLGLTAHQSGNHARATHHIENAVALKPRDPLYLNNLGLAQYAAGRFVAAAESFRRVMALGGDRETAQLHLGTVLALQDRHEDALVEFLSLINNGTPKPIWHAKAGQTLRLLGRFDAAEVQFRAAPALLPYDVDLQANLALLLHIRGRDREAVALYRKVLNQRPDFPDVLINLGNGLIDLGLLDEAQKSFTAALDLEPASEGALSV